MREWVATHGPSEGDEIENEEFPWHPELFFGGGSASLDIQFRTEAECVAFIREEIMPALEGARW